MKNIGEWKLNNTTGYVTNNKTSGLTLNGALQYLYTWELLTEQPSLYDLLIRKH
jgi:hypothetical protein